MAAGEKLVTGGATVSVIIPTFNRARMVAETVHSAAAQTHRPFEIIVVDDGSTDDTQTVLRTVPGITVVSRPNGGAAAARNSGAEVARGEWLAFLDCEDLWKPEKLELQLRIHGANPGLSWSVSDCTAIDRRGNPVEGANGWQRVFPVFNERGLDPEAYFTRFLPVLPEIAGAASIKVFAGDLFQLLFHGNIALPSSALVRRSVFNDVGRFDPDMRLAEEVEFFHRLSAEHPGAVIMEPLVGYRLGDGGHQTSPANSRRLILGALESLDRASRLRPLSKGDQAAMESGLAALVLRLAWTEISNYEPAGAREALARLPESARRSPRARRLRLLSALPPRALRLLHTLKRSIRA